MTTANHTHCKIAPSTTFEGHPVCHKHHAVLQKTGINSCTICFDHVIDANSEDVIKLSGCNHVFHISCIADWDGGCPNCRHPLSTPEMMGIQRHALRTQMRDIDLFSGHDGAMLLRKLRQVVQLCTTGSYESVSRVTSILQHAENIADPRVTQQIIRYFEQDVDAALEHQMLADESESVSIDESIAVLPEVPTLPGVPGVLGPVFDQMVEQVVLGPPGHTPAAIARPIGAVFGVPDVFGSVRYPPGVPPMPADYTPTASPSVSASLVPVNVAPIQFVPRPQLAGIVITTLPPGMSVVPEGGATE